MGSHTYRLGIDIGGTFTDLVIIRSDGFYAREKVLSTPSNYSDGVIAGIMQLIERYSIPSAGITEIVHGTTVGTNAILERKGALTALITTKGFRDVLEMRRMTMPDMYDWLWDKPTPLVERHLRLEVDERVGATGAVLKGLDDGEVQRLLQQIRSRGCQALAVCLMNSYVNPIHEHRIGEIVREQFPDLSLSLSCEVSPYIEEFERTSTTVTNAYIMPVFESYLGDIQRRLKDHGLTARLHVMESNGGMMPAHATKTRPVYALESGPAAGVVAAEYLSKTAKLGDVVTFDMGGTTAKASLIENGQPHRTLEYEIGAPISLGSRLNKGGGYLIRVPAINIAEVGAGGGSIAWLDSGGVLHVGPQSTGADPGPACYDRGGAKSTVTDANVVLGYLNPKHLVGGNMPIRYDLAYRAIEDGIAKPLRLSVLDAAFGIHRIANSNMTRAIRAVSTEQGKDVRQFSLLAFGGNGPVHASGIAQIMDIPRVTIPACPGVFSAVGLLFAQMEHHLVRTILRRGHMSTWEDIERSFTELEGETKDILLAEGYPAGAFHLMRLADLEYVGQASPLTVPVNRARTSEPFQELKRAFEEEYMRLYGRAESRHSVEVVSVRVVGKAGRPETKFDDLTAWSLQNKGTSPWSEKGAREKQDARYAYFGQKTGPVRVQVLDREGIPEGISLPGPVLIEEYDSTIVVPPGCAVCRDQSGNIVVNIGQPASDAS